MYDEIESTIREEAIVQMDIAIYKSIAYDRMEKIKNETYGNRTFNKSYQIDWKMSIAMLLNVFG
ncbi:hypothetical protein CHI07_02175 [Paenibacillus sp. 7884-2]|nr:hypothetical protein CHI07_02175 [Paenibacillus sp. 7884-2]